ncbi:MAG: selenide, water dikinase SelD, partial [Bacteroidales bacterium]|nr:selenide, water dikinase SelD [Bacteroidales bacterium]
TGILTTAMKRGLLGENAKAEVTASMAELNKKAADILHNYTVHACTDVTGFGLIGHLSEVTVASSVNAELFADAVPFFPEAANLAAAGIIPGGTTNNLSYFSRHTNWGEEISAITRAILCDAQTSGGLLVTVPAGETQRLLEELRDAGLLSAAHIGNCTARGNGTISVKLHRSNVKMK